MEVIRFDQPSSQAELVRLTEPGTYRIEVAAPDLQVIIKGAFHLQDNEQQTIEVLIVHQAPRTTSRTLLRGVGQDHSQLTLKGTIVVEPAATQTNAFLTENILLLNAQARAEAIPNLEIQTDDVKCSHAATVSTLSPEEVFYLQSRGIPMAQAQQMIVEGFLMI